MMKNIVLIGFVFGVCLFHQTYVFCNHGDSISAQVSGSLLDFAKTHSGKSSYGNYMRGKKVGWDTDEIKLTRLNGAEVVVQVAESYFSALFGGNKTVVIDRTETFYSLEGNGDILSVKSSHIENGVKKSRELLFKNGSYFLVTTSQNRKSEKMVEKPRENLAMQIKLESWLKGNRNKGDVFECFSTVLEEDDFNVPTKYIYKGKKNVRGDGKDMIMHEVDQETHGALFYSILDNTGRLYSGRMGKIIEYRLESDEFAKKIDNNLVDLIQISAVALDRKLGDPAKVNSLKLSLVADEEFDIPQSHRQIVTKGNDGKLLLEIKRDFILKKGKALSGEDKKQLLSPTASLPSDNQKILDLANNIVGDASSSSEKASRIVRWVFANLEKTMAKNSDNALDVLDKKAGDCTEHTLLFVTLARAVGLPAREVGGVAYMAGEKSPKMAWHAWAEFHDGKQWITADPTWNQVLVDGTHIKFSEGSTDLKWLNILGGLELKVVDLQRE
jgi:hypothetical protein